MLVITEDTPFPYAANLEKIIDVRCLSSQSSPTTQRPLLYATYVSIMTKTIITILSLKAIKNYFRYIHHIYRIINYNLTISIAKIVDIS